MTDPDVNWPGVCVDCGAEVTSITWPFVEARRAGDASWTSVPQGRYVAQPCGHNAGVRFRAVR